MPIKPKKPCAYPGCPNLTHDTYCEEHQALSHKQYDKFSRAPNHDKKYGNNWRRIRALYVKQHPLCERCLKEELHLSKGPSHRTSFSWRNEPVPEPDVALPELPYKNTL